MTSSFYPNHNASISSWKDYICHRSHATFQIKVSRHSSIFFQAHMSSLFENSNLFNSLLRSSATSEAVASQSVP